MHIHVCLLVSMLYLHVSLPRDRFCHALYPLWVCAYVFTSVPPRVCLDVTTWRYTFEVLECLFYTFLHSVRCWYACLAFFTPPVWLSLLLCILACLPTCSCMSLFVIHTSIQWNYGHLIQTYICPSRTPFCLIIFCLLFYMLFYPFTISFLCFFASLLACFFGLCIYTHGARVWLPRCKQKGQGCKPTKGNDQ